MASCSLAFFAAFAAAAALRLRQPILANETGTVLSTERLPFIQAALTGKMVVVSPSEKCEHPGNLGWDSAEDDRSRDRSAILSTQVRLTRRKQTASHATYLPKTSTWAQLTIFTESYNYLLSSCSINAWEGHWYSAWIGLTPVHEWGENWSERLGYVVFCAGAAAHGPWRGLNFIVWNFAWDRLASRLYAATATTFLMKIPIYIRQCVEKHMIVQKKKKKSKSHLIEMLMDQGCFLQGVFT